MRDNLLAPTAALAPPSAVPAAWLSELPGCDPQRLAASRVALCGLGNIGGHVALHLAPLVRALLLIDRDRFSGDNLANQAAPPGAVGRPKAEVFAELLRERSPSVACEAMCCDLADVGWSLFDGVDLAIGALDSLLARQTLCDLALPQGVPVLDGAVGPPLLGLIQHLRPGGACLECAWGPQHYRQLAAERPCGGAQVATADVSPSVLGAHVASLIVGRAISCLAGEAPTDSEQLLSGLLDGRALRSRLTPASGCRRDHRVIRRREPLGMRFDSARLGDLGAAALRLAGVGVACEFRRLRLPQGLFDTHRHLPAEALATYGDLPLSVCGLSQGDWVLVRGRDTDNGCFLRLEER